jgi:hypothetical protein
MQDSPLGVRDSDYNSAFPAGGTVAASWDRGVWYERGFGMGSEHRGKGVDVQLGPVVGPLGRSPEGGRNWEGFSPDPVLSGIAVANTIKGIQGAGVIACKFLSLQDGKLPRELKPPHKYKELLWVVLMHHKPKECAKLYFQRYLDLCAIKL